jgi:ankyrin repeat protein
MMQNDNLTELLVQAKEGYSIPCFNEDGSIDLFAKSNCNDTLLHVAVGLSDISAIRYLVTEGLDLDSRGDYCETPYYLAAVSGKVDIMDVLRELGADASIPDHRGDTPEDALCRYRKKTKQA